MHPNSLRNVVCLGILPSLEVLIPFLRRESKTYVAHLLFSYVFSLAREEMQVLSGGKPRSLYFLNLEPFGTLDPVDLNMYSL